jgi:hypothetical protein
MRCREKVHDALSARNYQSGAVRRIHQLCQNLPIQELRDLHKFIGDLIQRRLSGCEGGPTTS